ncbi:hypothetical protein IX56_17350, partial [Paracoccus sanguinis]
SGTAGGNGVDRARPSAVAGKGRGRADAARTRAGRGLAMGGGGRLGPRGRVGASGAPRLSEFDPVGAAAGTPRHVFAAAPAALCRAAGARVADFTA